MQEDRWQTIQELTDAVSEIPQDQRQSWLQDKCGEDEGLVSDVLENLLSESPTLVTEIPEQTQEPSLSEHMTMKVGSWSLQRLLGEGGMGQVWLANRADAEFKMKAAVKLIREEIATPMLVERFKQERQILADLTHPHIAKLYDGGTTDQGLPYLVMEFVQGETIDRWCWARNLSVPAVLKLFRQTCQACGYAHRQGLIHRDIKPGNIMVDFNNMVKLMDFGIAGHDGERSPGELPITPDYASPERIMGASGSSACDMYSLGLTLLKVLTKKKVSAFKDRPREILDQHFQSGPQPPWPQALNNLLHGMLAQQPEDRPTCEAVINEIDIILTDPHLSFHKMPSQGALRYDAMFWAHPSCAEKVHLLAKRLSDEMGLRIWLEQWFLVPGEDVPRTMIQALFTSACLLVPFDEKGLGPWENEDVREFMLDALAQTDRRIVPVLLPGGHYPERESGLPEFLRRRAWAILKNDLRFQPLHALTAAILGAPPGYEDSEQDTITCPFRGLEAFREEDAPFFFGREATIQRLAMHLERHNFLAVLGPSGSGKSSVVQAGLTPILRERGYKPVLFTPSKSPLNELAFALTQLMDPEKAVDPAHIVQDLGQSCKTLYFQANQLVSEGDGPGICLIIDQFEEIFTLAEKGDGVNRFLDNLLYAVGRGQLVTVVLTLRSDFLGKCVVRPDLNRYIVDNLDQVEPMSRENLSQATINPARLAGLTFENGLLEKILDDVVNTSELPLLEHALLELYGRRRGRELTLGAYAEIGGIEGALVGRSEAEYKKLDESSRETLRKMFTLCLLQPGEGSEDTRRRATKSELIGVGDCDTVTTLLEAWTKARLLTVSEESGGKAIIYEVAHEALIRKWPRIAEWMADDREKARLVGRVRNAARAWDRSGRDEDLLPRGAPLLQMGELMEQDGQLLGDLEKTFITFGFHERDRQEKEREIIAQRLRTGSRVAILAGFVSIILGSIALWLFFKAKASAIDAMQQKDRAERARNVAEENAREMQYSLALTLEDRARQALLKDEPQDALLLTLQAMSTVPDTYDLPVSVGHVLRDEMTEAGRLRWISPSAPNASALGFSPDGQLLAFICGDLRIRVINMRTGGRQASLVGHRSSITAFTFSPDGKHIMSASEDGSLRQWQLSAEPLTEVAPYQMEQHDSVIKELVYSADGTHLIAARVDQTVKIWPVDDDGFQSPTTLNVPGNGTITAIATTPDSEDLYIGTSRGELFRIDLRDARTDTVERLLDGRMRSISTMAFDGSGQHLYLVSGEELVTWKQGQGVLRTQKPHEAEIMTLQWTPRGLLSSSRDGTLRLTSPEGGEGSVLISSKQPLVDFSLGADGQTLAYIAGSRLRGLNLETGGRFTLEGHIGPVSSVVFSKDDSHLVSASEDGTIRVWNVENGDETKVLAADAGKVSTVEYSPDGNQLASAHEDGGVRLWNPQTGQEQSLAGHQGNVTGVSYNTDGTLLASSGFDRTVHVWSRDGQLQRVLSGHKGAVNGCVFSPDGRRLYSGSDDHTIRVWDPNTGKLLQELRSHRDMVKNLALSPDGERLCSGSWDQTARLWNLESGGDPVVLQHGGGVTSAAFTPDGTRLATASYDHTVRIWDGRDGTPVKILKGHKGRVLGLAFSADGKTLATASEDRTVRLWEIDRQDRPRVLVGHEGKIYDAHFTRDGKKLISSGTDQMAILWDVAKGQPVKTFKGHSGWFSSACFSSDGQRLITASSDHSVGVWDVATRENLKLLEGHGDVVWYADISRDDRLIASVGQDQLVRVWDAMSGTQIHQLAGHTDKITMVEFGPEGRHLVTGSHDHTARIWDVERGEQKHVLKGHSGALWGVAFSHDGRYVASGAEDYSVRVWDVVTGREEAVLTGHVGRVYRLGFSHDGRFLASPSGDKTARIWDLQSKRPVAVLSGHGNEVNRATFNEEGTILATTSDDKTVRLWYLDHQLIAALMEPTSCRKLLNRLRYFFSDRINGLNVVQEPKFELKGYDGQFPEDDPLDRLGRPRPRDIPLKDWLLK